MTEYLHLVTRGGHSVYKFANRESTNHVMDQYKICGSLSPNVSGSLCRSVSGMASFWRLKISGLAIKRLTKYKKADYCSTENTKTNTVRELTSGL